MLLLAAVAVATVDGRVRMRGGKGELHSRSKRTIGDIINWKLGILQSLFGGIKGLFGGKGNSNGGSYGAPPPRQNIHLFSRSKDLFLSYLSYGHVVFFYKEVVKKL